MNQPRIRNSALKRRARCSRASALKKILKSCTVRDRGRFLFKCPRVWMHMLFLACVFLVGGFNPPEKYWSNWTSDPNRGENSKKYLSCYHLDFGWEASQLFKKYG